MRGPDTTVVFAVQRLPSPLRPLTTARARTDNALAAHLPGSGLPLPAPFRPGPAQGAARSSAQSPAPDAHIVTGGIRAAKLRT